MGKTLPSYGPLMRHNRFGKTRRRFEKPIMQESPSYVTETFEPKSPWKPFRLVNDSLGIAHTILKKMRWTDISREVLQDGTSSSALAQVVRGERKSINGWRCEWFDD